MDDVLLYSSNAADVSAAAEAEEDDMASDAIDAEGLDAFLKGVLPGAGMGREAATPHYLEDILGTAEEEAPTEDDA